MKVFVHFLMMITLLCGSVSFSYANQVKKEKATNISLQAAKVSKVEKQSLSKAVKKVLASAKAFEISSLQWVGLALIGIGGLFFLLGLFLSLGLMFTGIGLIGLGGIFFLLPLLGVGI